MEACGLSSAKTGKNDWKKTGTCQAKPQWQHSEQRDHNGLPPLYMTCVITTLAPAPIGSR